MSITRPDRRRLAHVAARVLREVLGRGAHEREHIAARTGNPIVVESAADVSAQVWSYFAAAHRYEGELHGLEFRLGDPDWHGDVAEWHRLYLDPARAEAEHAAITLIESLAAGGHPPRRWTWRRWARRVRYVRWYLREQQWNPARRREGCPDPWAHAPVAGAAGLGRFDEPPF